MNIQNSLNRVLVVGVFATAAMTFAGCGNKTNTSTTGGTSSTGTTSSDTSFSSSDAVATVNGDTISRGDLYAMMAAQSGEQTLKQLISYQAIMQQLKKNNLEVTDAEIDAYIESIKAESPQSAPQLDEIVKGGGSRLESLRKSARISLASIELMTKDVKVDDAKLKAWFGKNGAQYDKKENLRTGLLATSTKARADLMASQLKAKTKTFAQLVEEQGKANDPQGRSSTITNTPTGTRAEIVKTFGPQIGSALQKVPIGGNTSVILAQPKPPAYVIAGIVSGTPAQKADFTKMRAQAEQDYKLEQVAREEIKKSGNQQPFEAVVKQYEAGMAQQGGPKPSYRNILTMLTQPRAQAIQTDVTKGMDLKINDPELVKVAEQFPTPTPAASPAGSPGATSSASPAAASPAASPAG